MHPHHNAAKSRERQIATIFLASGSCLEIIDRSIPREEKVHLWNCSNHYRQFLEELRGWARVRSATARRSSPALPLLALSLSLSLPLSPSLFLSLFPSCLSSRQRSAVEKSLRRRRPPPPPPHPWALLHCGKITRVRKIPRDGRENVCIYISVEALNACQRQKTAFVGTPAGEELVAQRKTVRCAIHDGPTHVYVYTCRRMKELRGYLPLVSSSLSCRFLVSEEFQLRDEIVEGRDEGTSSARLNTLIHLLLQSSHYYQRL